MKKGKVKKEGFCCGCCECVWVLGPDDAPARGLYQFRVERGEPTTKEGLVGTICQYCYDQGREHGKCQHERFFFGENPNYKLILESEVETAVRLMEIRLCRLGSRLGG